MANPVFPNGIKQWTDKRDFIDDVEAKHINEAYAEIIAMETELLKKLPSDLARSATVVVAASNSGGKSKIGADFVCTGSNDDVVINQAISSLPSVGGKVLLMEGIYILNDGIKIGDNTIFEGTGFSTVLKLKDNAILRSNTGIIGNQTSGNYNIKVCNLTIEGNGSNQSSSTSGLYMRYVTNLTLEHLLIQDTKSVGIGIFGCENCFITDSIIQDPSNAGISVQRGKYVFVYSNIVKTPVTSGLYLYGSAFSVIKNNFFIEGLSSGISSNESNNNSIVNNTVLKNMGDGISLSESNNNSVANNIILSNNLEYNRTWSSNLCILRSSYNSIQGNIIRKSVDELTQSFRGLLIHNSGSIGNLVINNDLHDSGSVANFTDNGAGTITTPGNRV